MQANEVERSLRASRLRTVALTLVLGASLGLLLWATPTWPPARSVSDLARWLRTTPPDAAMTTAAALLGWMCLIWLLGGALLITLSRLPGFVGAACAELAEHITPIVLRRAVNGALGTALVTGSVAVALPAAASSGATATSSSRAVTPSNRSPVQWPDLDRGVRGTSAAAKSARPGPATGVPADSAGERVTVHSGDSLWTIADRALGGSPSAARVATAWPRWYAANRSTVGADPDVIHPGQRLRPPASGPSAPPP